MKKYEDEIILKNLAQMLFPGLEKKENSRINVTLINFFTSVSDLHKMHKYLCEVLSPIRYQIMLDMFNKM